jgi:hypothetical protein
LVCALLLACSKETEDDDGCAAFCDYIVACTPGWVEGQSGETSCAWKFGEEEAHDRCLTSCDLATHEEGQTDEERRQCLECVVDAVGSSCLTRVEASEDCPCIFNNINYAVEAPPNIEPLTCDSGDVYPFTVDNETGEFVRERCLDGDRRYCD